MLHIFRYCIILIDFEKFIIIFLLLKWMDLFNNISFDFFNDVIYVSKYFFMKHVMITHGAMLKAAAAAIALLAMAGLAGCASSSGGGTASLNNSGSVQGRDLGRGGATSGGLSSLDRGDNSSDLSVYDARQMQDQQ